MDKLNKIGIKKLIPIFLLVSVMIIGQLAMAAQKEIEYRTEDGEVVKVLSEKTSDNNNAEIAESSGNFVVSGDLEDETIEYGTVIEKNGVKERVWAIGDDGSFITEVLE